MEVVNAATELIIEHREVKSEVMFLGYLPSDAAWRNSRIGQSGIIIITGADITVIITVFIPCPEFLYVWEAGSHIVVTYLTIWVAQLKHIQPFEMFLDDWLFSDVPCYRIGGKESKLLTWGEVLGAVVTEIKVKEVAVFPSVCETSCKPLMTILNTLHNLLVAICIAVVRCIGSLILRIL